MKLVLGHGCVGLRVGKCFIGFYRQYYPQGWKVAKLPVNQTLVFAGPLFILIQRG